MISTMLCREKRRRIRRQYTDECKMMEWVYSVRICIPLLEPEELIIRSIDRYKRIWQTKDADIESDPRFINRICINYLRHSFNQYHYHLGSIKGLKNSDYACIVLKERINNAIIEAYPHLSSTLSEEMYRELVNAPGN